MVSVVGVAGLAAADRISNRYGLIPPDSGGIFGPGETLTYAAQRLLTRHSMAREIQSTQPNFAQAVWQRGRSTNRCLQEECCRPAASKTGGSLSMALSSGPRRLLVSLT